MYKTNPDAWYTGFKLFFKPNINDFPRFSYDLLNVPVEEGKRYNYNGELILCKSGFHILPNLKYISTYMVYLHRMACIHWYSKRFWDNEPDRYIFYKKHIVLHYVKGYFPEGFDVDTEKLVTNQIYIGPQIHEHNDTFDDHFYVNDRGSLQIEYGHGAYYRKHQAIFNRKYHVSNDVVVAAPLINIRSD